MCYSLLYDGCDKKVRHIHRCLICWPDYAIHRRGIYCSEFLGLAVAAAPQPAELVYPSVILDTVLLVRLSAELGGDNDGDILDLDQHGVVCPA